VYNKCLKLFFQNKRRASVIEILLDTGLPSFSIIMFNAAVILIVAGVKGRMIL